MTTANSPGTTDLPGGRVDRVPRPAPPGRVLLRWGLGLVAAEMFVIGIPASVAPATFFREFFFGRGWAGAIGPYNEHYVRDLGFVYTALGLVLVWGSIRLGHSLVRAALVAALVATVPHLLFHLFHTAELSGWDNLAQDGLLLVTAIASLGMLVLSYRVPAAAGLPGDEG